MPRTYARPHQALRSSRMSTPKKKAAAASGKGKKGTDAGSRVRAAMKQPVDKFKKGERTSKAKKK